MTARRRGFASDNAAGVHPEVLAAISAASDGHAFGYGHDPYTASVEERVVEALGGSAAGGARAFFVFNGSGANVLSLRACCRPWHAVVCSDAAHIHTDEAGAPEAVGGLKLLTVAAGDGGRIDVSALAPILDREYDEHSAVPRVLSLTESTELGGVYTPGQLRALGELVHAHGMLLHIDGARLANAAVALGVSLADLTSGVGADIVSFGGTKNGLLGCEAVVVLDGQLADGMLWLRKQSLQLASKMRFLAAQFDALLTDELWRRNATHANRMASRLAERLAAVDGVTLTRSVQSNAVFAVLAPAVVTALLERFDFYIWDQARSEVRWMCSWDTTEEDVDTFAAAVHATCRAAAAHPE